MRLFWKIGIGGIIILLTGLGIVLIKPEFAFLLREKTNPNRIIVETLNKLENQKVKIVWSSESGSSMKIFDKGKDLGKVYKEYGKNEFKIYYDNVLVGQFGQFKYNNWHGHKYQIKLRKDSAQQITFDLKVMGPDNNKVWIKRENAYP